MWNSNPTLGTLRMPSIVCHTSYKEDIIVLFTFIHSPNISIVKRVFYPRGKIVLTPRKKVPLSVERFPCQKLIA